MYHCALDVSGKLARRIYGILGSGEVVGENTKGKDCVAVEFTRARRYDVDVSGGRVLNSLSTGYLAQLLERKQSGDGGPRNASKRFAVQSKLTKFNGQCLDLRPYRRWAQDLVQECKVSRTEGAAQDQDAQTMKPISCEYI
jgi:hypothetical protein